MKWHSLKPSPAAAAGQAGRRNSSWRNPPGHSTTSVQLSLLLSSSMNKINQTQQQLGNASRFLLSTQGGKQSGHVEEETSQKHHLGSLNPTQSNARMCTNTSAPLGDKGNGLQPELAYQFAELFYPQICLLRKKPTFFQKTSIFLEPGS